MLLNEICRVINFGIIEWETWLRSNFSFLSHSVSYIFHVNNWMRDVFVVAMQWTECDWISMNEHYFLHGAVASGCQVQCYTTEQKNSALHLCINICDVFIHHKHTRALTAFTCSVWYLPHRPFHRLTLIPINVVTIHSFIIVIHSLLSVQSCDHTILCWSSSLSLDLHILDEFDCIKLYHSLSIIWLIVVLLFDWFCKLLILMFIRLYQLDREHQRNVQHD